MTKIQFLVLNLNFKTQKEIYFLMGHLVVHISLKTPQKGILFDGWPGSSYFFKIPKKVHFLMGHPVVHITSNPQKRYTF